MDDQLKAMTDLPTSLPIGGLVNDTSAVAGMLSDTDAASLTKLFTSEDWAVFQKFLDEWYKNYSQQVEVYMVNEEQARYDSGVRHAIKLIGFLKDDTQQAIEFYAKSNGNGLAQGGQQASPPGQA